MNSVYRLAMFGFLSIFVGNFAFSQTHMQTKSQTASQSNPWDKFYEKRRQAVRARSEANGKDLVDPKMRASVKKEIQAEIAKLKAQGKLTGKSKKGGTSKVTAESKPATSSSKTYTRNPSAPQSSGAPQSISVDKSKIPTELSFPKK